MNRVKLIILLALFSVTSPVLAGSVSSEMQAFGLDGTWSDDCAEPGALRETFAYHYFANPNLTLASQNDRDGKGTLYYEVVSASKVTDEKLKVMVIITGKDDVKVPKERLSEQNPGPVLYEKFGMKMKMDGRVMEKCLN